MIIDRETANQKRREAWALVKDEENAKRRKKADRQRKALQAVGKLKEVEGLPVEAVEILNEVDA